MPVVVIPFYKNKEQLDKCQAALKAQTASNITWNIQDDSETGNGFTKTSNKGLRNLFRLDLADDYAIVLNQDLYLRPDAIEKMVSFMDAHPRCAIAGIKQLSSKDEDFIIHGGTFECFPAGRHEVGRVSRGECDVSKQVPWVNGACMIVRLEAILGIGLMDENMKMFGSDADWSLTARARGWECWYIAEAVCVHEQGVSQSRSGEMEKTFERDMLYFRSKWIDGDLMRELTLEVLPGGSM
jgi:N-acetylglucosaminyl-diphospho-decaprenol L-rhamnosyltransferase